MRNIEDEIRGEVIEEIDLSYDVSDVEIIQLIREKIIEKSKQLPVSLKERQVIETHVFNSLRKLDVLEDLLSDEDITVTKTDSIGKNLFNTYLLGAHIYSNLIEVDYMTPLTAKNKKQNIKRI